MPSVAIPDSCLADESTKLAKSKKISVIARACSIFGVDTIYVYEDGGTVQDRHLLVFVLRYMETPPFLRRRLFAKSADLKYAGALSPLKIPSHTVTPSPDKITPGNVREGVIVSYRSRQFVDAGFGRPLEYRGPAKPGSRIMIRFTSAAPELKFTTVPDGEAKRHRGYEVKQRGQLYGFASKWDGPVILTSRRGKPVTIQQVREYASQDGTLVIFGSTERGLHEILGPQRSRLQGARSLNFFPNQKTQTVRLEEAMLGVLAILGSEM